jgi:hypothetical protein
VQPARTDKGVVLVLFEQRPRDPASAATGFPEDASLELAPPSAAPAASVAPSTTLTTPLEPKTRSPAAMDTDALVVFDKMPSR